MTGNQSIFNNWCISLWQRPSGQHRIFIAAPLLLTTPWQWSGHQCGRAALLPCLPEGQLPCAPLYYCYRSPTVLTSISHCSISGQSLRKERSTEDNRLSTLSSGETITLLFDVGSAGPGSMIHSRSKSELDWSRTTWLGFQLLFWSDLPFCARLKLLYDLCFAPSCWLVWNDA